MDRQSQLSHQIGEAGGTAEARNPSLKERAVREVKIFIAMSLYLFVLFSLFVLYEDIILARVGVTRSFTPYGFAVVNALVLAKIMLIAEDLHLGRRFENWPLIYPILFKAIAFAIVLLAFHLLEELAVGMLHGKTAAESLPQIGGSPKAALTVATILAVQLVPFFAFTEMRRAIGRDDLYALLFTRRSRGRSTV